MPITYEENLAYLAGLLDGEGCVRIGKDQRKNKLHRRKNPSYFLDVRIEMVNAYFLKDYAKKFGGCIYQRKRIGKHGESVMWLLYGKKASEFLSLVLPYLNVKKEEAKKAIEFQSMIGARNTKALTRLQIQLREYYFNLLKSLKVVNYACNLSRETKAPL